MDGDGDVRMEVQGEGKTFLKRPKPECRRS